MKGWVINRINYSLGGLQYHTIQMEMARWGAVVLVASLVLLKRNKYMLKFYRFWVYNYNAFVRTDATTSSPVRCFSFILSSIQQLDLTDSSLLEILLYVCSSPLKMSNGLLMVHQFRVHFIIPLAIKISLLLYFSWRCFII